MIKLSICIPTFNRLDCLENCLYSISESKKNSNIKLEVCVSDNNSLEDPTPIINRYKDKINIKFNRNNKNIGIGKNIVKAVSMATGEFAWIRGNDDLFFDKTLDKLDSLFTQNPEVDFYYINSFHLGTSYTKKFPFPFSTNNIDIKMKKFSSYNKTRKLNFFQLINPNISFDFLMGIFLSVFRKKNWDQNINMIDQELLSDPAFYSNTDNTFPHIKVWGKAFNNSKAMFIHEPLSVCLYGEREWSDLYPFVEVVRMPDALTHYKNNGMSWFRYVYCKNFALRKFIPSYFKMIMNYKNSGIKYVNFKKDILYNLLYPSIYISGFYFIIRKFLKIIFLKDKKIKAQYEK